MIYSKAVHDSAFALTAVMVYNDNYPQALHSRFLPFLVDLSQLPTCLGLFCHFF